MARFPGPQVRVQHPLKQGSEGYGGNLLHGHPGESGGLQRQAASQVDEIEVQGNEGLQLDGAAAFGRHQVADLEHLGVGEFVHQAPQVVQRPAVLRIKIG